MTLYISDLDGTLLSPQAALSAFATENLLRLMRNGLRFTIATARTWESSRVILRDILPLPVPVVLQNGALIYDTQTQRYVKKEIIPESRVLALLRVVKAHNQAGFLYSIKGDRISPFHEDLSGRPILREFRESRVRIYGKRFTQAPDLSAHAGEDIVYFTIQGTYDGLAPLRDAVEALPGIACVLYPDSYLAGYWFFECFSASATKYNAARFLREAYHFDKIIGFGDNLNDLPLFRACGESYAVSNAREELKAAATGVIGSNTEDGVVQFMLDQAAGAATCRPPHLNLTIRPATIADAPALAEIHSRGWETAYADIVPAQAIAERRPRRPAQWQAWLSRPHEISAAVLDGQVVGFLSLRRPEPNENLPDHYYEVGGIYLHPEVYRQGIGRKLMAFAEEQARAKGKSAMMLWVFEDNAPSRRFYEACGYRPDSATEEREYGRTLRSLRYVKEI